MHAGVAAVPQALAHVRRVRPIAEPNEGFMAQLLLFGDMRCSLNPEHPVYRMWCVEQVGVQQAGTATAMCSVSPSRSLLTTSLARDECLMLFLSLK